MISPCLGCFILISIIGFGYSVLVAILLIRLFKFIGGKK